MVKISYVNKIRLFLFVLALVGVLTAALSSCARKGLGCKGRTSWNQMIYNNTRP